MSAEQFRQWAASQPGALVSGEPIGKDFVEGWGHHPFMRGMKAHHWHADLAYDDGSGTYGLHSACGLTTVATKRVPLLQPGNLPFCTRCENRLMRAIR